MDIKLEEGEVICSRCEGRGCSPFFSIQEAQETCPKCNGEGKLDWVSNAMVKENLFYEYKNDFIKFASECLKNDIDKNIMGLFYEKNKT